MDNLKLPPTSCFISYCHDDADNDAIEAFENLLRAEGPKDFRVYRDKSNIRSGTRISEHEKVINSVDAVILLLTPKFKKKVINRTGGVDREFNASYARYLETNPISAPSAEPFLLIPILFSGDLNSSVPREIEDIFFHDFTKFRAIKNKANKITVPNAVKRQYKPILRDIIKDIQAVSIDRSELHRLTLQQYINLLLVETKDENVRASLSLEDRSYMFVKTRAYNRVKNQHSLILIGRKGTGKSTITDYIHSRSSKSYKDKINIDINDFRLEYVFEIVFDPRLSSELKNTLPQNIYFEIVWRLFINLCCMRVLVIEHEKGRLSDDQEDFIGRIANFILRIIPDEEPKKSASDLSYWPMFVWCMNKVNIEIDDAISSSRNSLGEFTSDLAHKVEPQIIFNKIVDKALKRDFKEVLKRCRRRFMISVDGFDTNFDQFRITTLNSNYMEEQKRFRIRMETDWLRSLLHQSMKMRSDVKGDFLHRTIDFCITVPKDRFMEIREFERDAYEFRMKYADIHWTAIELAILVRKRLEIITGIFTDENKTPLDRLTQILKEGFPGLPSNLSFQYGEEKIKICLFYYILRHTFWRPRDVLFYLAQVISTYKTLKGRKQEFDEAMVRKMISRTTSSVIRTEFINEFKSMCPNINDVVSKFSTQSNFLNYAQLRKILSDVTIEHSYRIGSDGQFQLLREKIDFLYEVGFLGFETIDTRDSGVMPETFYFSDSDSTFNNLSDLDKEKLTYIIHPSFIEYLRLRTSGNPFTLCYTDDYVNQNDQLPPWVQ